MSYGRKLKTWEAIVAALAIGIPFGIYFVYCLNTWFP
jgi:hypothetical protein